MAIQMRRGAVGNLDRTKLLPGEWAICTDGTIVICYASGKTVDVVTKNNIDRHVLKIENSGNDVYTVYYSDNSTEELTIKSGVEVDNTLTVSGKAADAKVVGDKFSKLSEETAELKSDFNQLRKLDLVVGADGKVYITINGVIVGNGLKIESSASGGEDEQPIDDTPQYVKDEALALIQKVKSHQNDNTISLLCISDMHNAETTEESSYANTIPTANKHCGQGAYIVANMCDIDLACYLGDYLLGGTNATYEYAINDFNKANSYLEKSFALAPNARIWGNHDTLANSWTVNGNTMWSESDLADRVVKYNVGWTWGSQLHNYGYRDIGNIRFIMLNTNEADFVTSRPIVDSATHYVSDEQKTWLENVLSTMPSDKSAIILSHHPLDWSSSRTRPCVDIIERYASKVLCALHGHTHNYRVDKMRNTALNEVAVKEIAIPNACFHRNNEYTTLGNIKWGTDTTYSKTINSANDTAFCVVTIDPVNKVVYADHYGAGEDRVVNVATSKVTVSATGCTINTPTNVMNGDSFSTTIVLGNNSELDSVSVKMGGVDITNTALSGTTINIASVTGDIVINAVASVHSKYTNLLDIQRNEANMPLCANKLINGYRTNSSSSTIGTAYSASIYSATSTGRATGLLPINGGTGDVIRVKGAFVGSSSNDAVILFNENMKSVAYTNGTNFANHATDFAVTIDEANKTMQFTIPNKFPSGASTTNARYLVLGFTNTRTVADNGEVIITCNEEIA